MNLKIFKKNINILVLAVIIASAFSIGYFIHFYMLGQTNLFGDGMARLNISRRLIYSKTPGIAQLGGIWLPLPSILMSTTSWISEMYYTGISGSAVSMIAFVSSVLFLYKLLYLLLKNTETSLFGTFILLLNPSIAYIQTTPMTESLSIAFIIMASYYILYWYVHTSRVALIKSAFIVLLFTLTRYEGWVFAITTGLSLLIGTLLKKQKKSVIESTLLLYGCLALFGILIWLIYNTLIFGNPFNFMHEIGSTATYVSQQKALGMQLTEKDLFKSVLLYSSFAAKNIGWLIFVTSSMGLLFLLKDRSLLKKSVFILPMISIVGFHVFALYSGRTYIVYRYGIYALVPALILSSVLYQKSSRFLRILFVIILLFQIVILSTNPATLQEAKGGYYSNIGMEQKNVAQWIRQHPTSGNTLVSTLSSDNVIYMSRLPFNSVIQEGNNKIWHQALRQPSKYASRIIIMYKGTGGLDSIERNMHDSDILLRDYFVAYENNYYKVYDLKKN